MKHVDLFDDFLKDTVNLNQTRLDELDSCVGADKSSGCCQTPWPAARDAASAASSRERPAQ
jgi:hypothetical protein